MKSKTSRAIPILRVLEWRHSIYGRSKDAKNTSHVCCLIINVWIRWYFVRRSDCDKEQADNRTHFVSSRANAPPFFMYFHSEWLSEFDGNSLKSMQKHDSSDERNEGKNIDGIISRRGVEDANERFCSHSHTKSHRTHFIWSGEINKFLKLILFDNWFIKVVVTAHTHIHAHNAQGKTLAVRACLHVLNNRMKNWINWNDALDIAYIMGLHESESS